MGELKNIKQNIKYTFLWALQQPASKLDDQFWLLELEV